MSRAVRLITLLLISCIAVAVPAAAQTPPVAAYGLNETSGTLASDASGNGHTGTLTGATWTAAGRFGGAATFNGTTNWITVNHSSLLSLTSAMTLEAWVKTGSATNWRTVLLKETSNGLSYSLYAGDLTGRPAVYILRTGDIDATSSSSLPLNQWVHLATTYDGATLRLFVNGVQAAATTITGPIGTSTLPLRIGGNSVWGEYFAGQIDEVRIYNRALSAGEIQTDMNTPVSGVAADTYSISGSIAPASSGSGATVALTGLGSMSTTADANGNYSFVGLRPFLYEITPAKSGITFSPAARSVTIGEGGNVTGINFTGTPVAGTGPIQRVQTAVNGFEFSSSSISTTFPAANTAGNFLIVTGTAARPAGTLTISDSAGNTYTPAIGPVHDPAQDVNVYIWYVQACRGGNNTITLTPTSARALEIHASEWSGVATVSPLDQTSWAVGSGTLVSTPSVTTTTNGALIFAYSFVEGDASPGSGYTALSLVNGDLDEYRIQPSAGPVSATFTQSENTAWIAAMLAVRPNTAPVPTDPIPPTVSLTAPLGGAVVAAATQLSATATDNVGVTAVQFQVNNADVGAPVTAAPYTLTWDTTSTPDGTYSVRAVARDAAGNVTVSSAATVTVANTATPSMVGQWGSSFDLGTVAVNMVMLRTGKVLMFSGSFTTSAPERIWDPVTGAITLVPNPYYNLFCAGHAQLPDGRILLAGGFDSASLGARNANIFDPVTLAWTALPNMTYRRWYPSVTALPDGRALVSSGAQSCLTCLADVPEIFDPATNRFTAMTSSRLAIDYYPFMFVIPDGRVLSAGSTEDAYETRTLNITTGAWTMIDPVVKDGHSAVMYRPGKVLKTGTAADSGTPGVSAPTAYVLDMTQPAPAWRQVASMRHARAFQNSTILPDGNVLITGGGTSLEGYDVTKGVLAAELWSPATETWTTLSSAAYARLYHATALLLPDGRVLMAGSGNDGPAVDNTRGEIYSPPYLFKGPRPTIAAAPDLIQYGGGFSVQTPDASSIASVVLIRPGAVTHGFDADQRYVPLSFTANAGSLTVQAPANANLAPPGYYMLFLVNASGVPSVASFVRFPAPASDTTAPSVPANLTGTGGLGTASLTWGPSTDDQSVALYNVHRATVSGFTATLANRVAQTGQTAYSSAGLAPATYFFAVTAQDPAGNISGQSSEFAVTVFADVAAPNVAITSPADQGPVSGSVSLVATASDDVGVVGVQFRLDGASLGAERTTAPYSMTWNSTSVPNGPHRIAASARDAAGNQSETAVTVTVSNLAPPPPPDATPPNVAITSPADQGPVSGSVSLVATASDDVGVVGVQFLLDGASLGPERTTAPYSMTWNSTSVPNGPHTIAASARDAAGNQSETTVTVTVSNLAPPPPPDATPPNVTITSPADQGSVSGSVSLVATASDDVGVVGVQFRLDGAPLGAERTTAPYAITWNSTSVPNGSHTIAASARDAAGNQSEAIVTVDVSNVAPPPPPAPTGLVAAYNFDEGTGAQVLDLSGRGHHGAASNTTWSTAGRTGAALSFNGTSSWVTIADTPALRLTAGMTIEAWVRPLTRNGWRTVILKERPGNLAYGLYASNDNSRPEARIWTGSEHSANANDIANNTWTHLAATYDGTALRFYTNGVLVRTRSGIPNILASTGALRIGGNAVFGEYYRGLIDDVRIYNRALTQAQIQADMNTPVR